jgi:DNA gyrase subunit A
MFATRSGDVRRNSLSDFVNINRAGKLAMRLEEGDSMVGVALCREDQDILLTTALGRCIRFAVDEVRVFKGRESTGVRGVRLAAGDQMISMAVLNRVEATPAERAAYLRHERNLIAAESGEAPEAVAADDEEEDGDQVSLTQERIAELGAAEQHVLTVADTGLGKRTSSYEYRRTGRGGSGLIAHDLSKRGGKLVASFPVENGDEILLVTDGGQLIRVPVGRIRIAGRNTLGVIIFRTAEGERVVSVERRAEGDEDEEPAEG